MKYISVRRYILRSQITTGLLLLFLIFSQCFFLFNLYENSCKWDFDYYVGYTWLYVYIIALAFSFLFLGLSFFQIRTVTKSEQRFLGYKSYILFYFKVIFLLACLIATLIKANYWVNNNYYLHSGTQDAMQSIYYFGLIMFLIGIVNIFLLYIFIIPLKISRKDAKYDLLTIDYHKKVKDWKTVGNIN